MTLLEYWNSRARTYSCEDVVGRTILASFIEQVKPRTLIEIGCGTGILFKLYKNIPQVSACDFSTAMLERARQRCERHGFKVNLFKCDITKEPPDGFWDLAVTRTCLMHISPDSIQRAVENISKICHEALIFEFWQPLEPRNMSPHNWLHDYQTLFENAGFNLEHAYIRNGVSQVLFWFKKET